MADLLQSGVAWLAGQLRAQASETVTYARGGVSFPLQATAGTTALRLDDGAGGTRVEHTDRDFILAAADLAAGGIPGEPLRGDRVTVATGEVYEAHPYAGEPPWAWCDPFRLLLRVRCKLVTGW